MSQEGSFHMVIRNTSPTPPKPTITPPKTEGPKPTEGTSSVDGTSDVDGAEDIEGMSHVDGITDIDELAGMTTTAGMSEIAPSALATRRMVPARNPEQVADAKNPKAVEALILNAAGPMGPGDVVTLGGKLALGEAIVVDAGAEVSMTKRPDGKYDVKMAISASGGAGAIAGKGPEGAKGAIVAGAAHEVTYTVSSVEEAAKVMVTEAARAAALGTPISGPISVFSDFVQPTPSETKVSVTLEAEAESEVGAKLGLTGEVAFSVVEGPSGTFFLEAEGQYKGKAGGPDELQQTILRGTTLKGSAKATVWVPINAPSAESMADPRKLISGALENVSKGTVTIDVDIALDRVTGAGAIKATKSFSIIHPEAALSSEGWSVSGRVAVGPKDFSAKITGAEVELTARAETTVIQSATGSLDTQVKRAVDEVKAIQTAQSGALRSFGR